MALADLVQAILASEEALATLSALAPALSSVVPPWLAASDVGMDCVDDGGG